tara:strand:- start:389 stop:949 length:561 start_codon:yes stop_codon:yes gene_type:complete
MKLELIIFGITGFLIANTYYDGKYIKIMQSWKKYYQMTFFGFLGLSLYLFIKKHPTHTKGMVRHATDLIKYMPIDKGSSDLLTPLFDFTTKHVGGNIDNQFMDVSPQQKRMMNSGGNSTKRSVSETKKKYVASNQEWKCASCGNQLQAWFEVDHIIRLEHGGTNHVDNLAALCRNCHGQKTAMENL